MAAIASLSDLINRLTGGASGTPEQLWFTKAARRAGAAPAAPIGGRWTSLWTYDGSPSAGVVPGVVAIPDNTTAGGLLQTDPAGGREKWLVGGGITGLAQGTVLLYDRLLHIGGFSGIVTTAQNVGGTLTRYTNGLGNMIMVEVYTQIGATGTTITASYTDQGGTAAQITPAVAFGNANFREAERIIVLPLASGDSGVQAVASVTVLATTGTAGNFGVTIAHPIAYLDIAGQGIGPWRSFIDGETIPEIQIDACLALAWMPGSATVPELMGCLSMVEA